MPIEADELRKLFKSEGLPCIPYAIVDDKMIMENKQPGAYYFLQLAQKSGEKMVDSCRYELTFNEVGGVDASHIHQH